LPLKIEWKVPEDTPLGDVFTEQQRRDVSAVNGLRRRKLTAGEFRERGEKVD
jgi:hypothetical protein